MTDNEILKYKTKLLKRIDVNAITGCWEMKGTKKSGNYATFTINGVVMQSHRSSYILFKGEIGNGLCVCHKCDNPPCVNPDHLFLGTKGDNFRDAVKKGRRNNKLNNPGVINPKIGEKNGSAKLTSKDVFSIREMINNKETCTAIARKFNVSRQTISAIKTGYSWSKVKRAELLAGEKYD